MVRSNDDPEVKIAVLQIQMGNIEKKVDEGFAGVTKQIEKIGSNFDGFITHADMTFATKEELGDVRHIATTRNWVMAAAGLLIGIITSVITALLVFFFTKR